MARRRRLGKVAINTSLMIDTLIASLIVQKAPGIINSLLFKDNPTTGQTATLVGVGAAYLYGMLMKNSNVANIGIALGAVDFLSPFIDQAMGSLGMGDYFALNDYGRLDEYTNDAGGRMTVHQYQDSY
jgi:hypothetical protein